MKTSPTFCAAPFIHQHIGNAGTSRLCCAQGGKFRYTWNDESMQEVRRKMLNGERVEGCEGCYHSESIGSVSHRNLMNQQFTKFKPNIEKGNETGLPLTFDLRLNNICNLQCRMCGPYSSSQIEKQLKKHPELLKYDHPATKPRNVFLNLSKAKEVKLLGGEPMLQPEAYDILNQLDSDVQIFITSNLTNLNTRFMKLLKKFNKVKIHWSIDGTENTYEYIRHPAKWRIIEKNLKQFRREFPNINDRIHVCVSVYNIFDFWKISNYVEGGCDYICVDTPYEMNPAILPDKWREFALDEFYQNYNGHDDLYDSKLAVIVDRLENGKHDPEKMKVLKARTELYDNAYGKSIYDYIPIFKEVFE